MKKPVKIILIDDANEAYKKLNETIGKQIEEKKENTNEMRLLRSINQKKEFIKQNPFYGDNIKKELIPKKYNVTNLWRVELTGYWRMLYTIKGDQIEIICFILDMINHDKYNQLFRYKKR